MSTRKSSKAPVKAADNTVSKVVKIQEDIRQYKDFKPESMKRYFKVGKGDYAEHDKFWGVSNPSIRKVAKQYVDADEVILDDIQALLLSEYNEERALALVMLVNILEKLQKEEKSVTADELTSNLNKQQEVFQFYLRNTKYINNWNLVDMSSYQVVGAYLLKQSVEKQEEILFTLAKSNDLWERRISIVSTMAFIRQEQFHLTIAISKMLLTDDHDLIHKATGWMLRETGKRNATTLKNFLDEHAVHMPKVMLRYSIERISAPQQKKYLNAHSNHIAKLKDAVASAPVEEVPTAPAVQEPIEEMPAAIKKSTRRNAKK